MAVCKLVKGTDSNKTFSPRELMSNSLAPQPPFWRRLQTDKGDRLVGKRARYIFFLNKRMFATEKYRVLTGEKKMQ